MDPHMGTMPLPNSLHSTDSTANCELNKKRKLVQYEPGNSSVPRPKHKTRDQSARFNRGSSIVDKDTDIRVGDESEIESAHDSNSFIEGPDNKMLTLGTKSNTEELSRISIMQQQPSTSSNNSVSRLSKETLYSLESRSIKEVNHGLYADEWELEETKEIEPEAETNEDDITLYSNDLPPFLLSSGRWSFGQDARPGTRKPTIDQEFEQYFSSLML